MTNPFTPPRTWVQLETPDRDTLNTHIRDQFRHIKDPPYGASALTSGVTFTNTAFTGIASALAIGLTTYGGIVEVGLIGAAAAGGGQLYLDVAIDGTRIAAGASGIIQRNTTGNAFFNYPATGIPSGAHSVVLYGRVDGGANAVLLSGALFWAMEYP